MVEAAEARDYRSVDWARVRHVVYAVRQHYRYTYTGPIHSLHQRLVMVPAARHGDQQLASWDLDVRGGEGARATNWESDHFGNRVAHVDVERVPHAVDFEAVYRVERFAAPERGAGPLALPAPEIVDELRQPTTLTYPDSRLRAVARELAKGEPLARAEAAHDWAAGAIRYQYGVTGYQTPAAMALALGVGVCQDYAHLLLCVLRLLGVPARYVSGHLLGEGAPHAWVEALVERPDVPGGCEVVAYDPTHRRRAGLGYITVAVGRDFADVTPTSGRFSGAATGRLSATKRAEIVQLDYATAVADEGAA